MSDETPTEGQPGQLSEEDRTGPVTHSEARKILSRFNASHWKHSWPTGGEVARYSIPADPRRDDDIRLDAYIAQNEKEQERLRGLLGRLRDFCEYVCDILNNHDMREEEDERHEGGILAEVRVEIGSYVPHDCGGIVLNGECTNCGVRP
jgi:hypothetical protein